RAGPRGRRPGARGARGGGGPGVLPGGAFARSRRRRARGRRPRSGTPRRRRVRRVAARSFVGTRAERGRVQSQAYTCAPRVGRVALKISGGARPRSVRPPRRGSSRRTRRRGGNRTSIP